MTTFVCPGSNLSTAEFLGGKGGPQEAGGDKELRWSLVKSL